MIDSLMVKERVRGLYVSLFGHRNYQRLAIVCNARTGSNFLYMGLCSSPRIKMYHEIFAVRHRRESGKNYDQVLATLFQKERRNIECVGCKLFYEHLSAEEWERFFARKEFKIIHLTRENRLRTIVSQDIAFMTDEWSVSNSDSGKSLKERRLVLDTTTLIARLEEVRDLENRMRQGFADRHILEVTYRELTRYPEATFQRIGEYIGVNDLDPTVINMAKQNPEALSQLIENCDEVSLLLKDTEFANCLSDE
jgi:LPS sulfotransferase NodH